MSIQSPENHVGTVSNLNCFIHRYLDTGFKTKWTGMWSPPYKYMDYFATRVNGVWLSPNTLDGTDYGEKMIFNYSTDSLQIKEEVTAPNNISGIKVKYVIKNTKKQPKAIQIALEPAVDIREKSQDIGPGDYDLDIYENGYKVQKDGKSLSILGGRPEGKSKTKTHYPDEKQRCFIPGKLVKQIEVGKKDEITFSFTFETEREAAGKLESREQSIEGPFEESLQKCIRSTENLIYEVNDTGVIAGHPWFQSFWARDSFWTCLGLIDAGRFEEVHSILETFAERDLRGKIDFKDQENKWNRSDTYPLYIIAAEKLKRYYKVSKTIEEGSKKAIRQLELRDDGVVKHSPEGTWMDTLERAPAIDIQSLWLEACELRNDIRASKLESGMEKFLENDYIQDSLERNSSRTINPSLALMFGQIEEKRAERYISTMNAEFSCQYGARTRSATDPGYDSSGYHTGSTWGLTTCWAAAANAKYDQNKMAMNMLGKLEPQTQTNQPGALPEVVDSETGELLGCPEQAWSSGLFVHVLDSYILGIEATEDGLKSEPLNGFKATRKGKRIGDELVDLKIEGGNTEILNRRRVDI